MNVEDRTTALGLFHFAHSYAVSAGGLATLSLSATHPDAPIRYLYSHSIELYLKSFLRLKGLTVSELRSRKYGHDMEKLLARSIELGLAITKVQEKQIGILNDSVRDRYIEMGIRTVLNDDSLQHLCAHLNNQIGPMVYANAGMTRETPKL